MGASSRSLEGGFSEEGSCLSQQHQQQSRAILCVAALGEFRVNSQDLLKASDATLQKHKNGPARRWGCTYAHRVRECLCLCGDRTFIRSC